MGDAEIKDFEQRKDQIKKELQQEASALTKSVYRTCLRSIRLIRPGNKHDEEEFQRREQKRLEEETGEQMEDDVRMGMFSMLPPVNREDELESRAEYYHQYARENFVQESDCLPIDDPVESLKKAHVSRYIFFLKKGDRDRKWLLKDMMFPDPYEDSFPSQRADAFEHKAITFVKEKEKVQRQLSGAPMYDEFLEELEDDNDDDDNDGSDSDDEEYPAWYRERFNK
jgi:hypothetical protein